MASVNEALVCRAVDVIWNRGDLDAADQLFDPAYVNHWGLITDLVRGPEAIKISAALHHLAFPELWIVVDQVSTADEEVHLRWTARNHRFVEKGSEPGGCTQQSLSGHTRSRILANRIAESWTDWDKTELLRRLLSTG